MSKLARCIACVMLVAAAVFLVQTGKVLASSVWACGSTGSVKDSFYTNDTVYACGTNLTASVSGYVRIYIVDDSNSWAANTTLSDAVAGYMEFQTNSTGDLPPIARWSSPSVGSYDMVADVDRNGMYNSTDYVDSLTSTGFSVALQPLPTLVLALGPYSPSSHNWDLSTNTTDNKIMQLKATAYENEEIILRSITLKADGSGDDKAGIKYVKMVRDVDGDGILNSTDPLVAYNQYLRDNGITTLTLNPQERIHLGNSTYFIIAYVMSDSAVVGDSFKFQILSADAISANSSTTARINGLPLDSATTTITGGVTTTTTTALSTTTSTELSTTTTAEIPTTTIPAETQTGLNYTLILSILIVVVVIAGIAVYYFFIRRKLPKYESPNEYQDLKDKWET